MKRRLAFLLALSLTFASFPVAGAGAAENTEATATQVVTEAEQEENSGEGASVEEETVERQEVGNDGCRRQQDRQEHDSMRGCRLRLPAARRHRDVARHTDKPIHHTHL